MKKLLLFGLLCAGSPVFATTHRFAFAGGLGWGFVTGSLGATASSGLSPRLRFLYFRNRIMGLELDAQYSRHTENLTGVTVTHTFIPINLGVRFAFVSSDKDDKIFTSLRPYLGAGLGLCLHSEKLSTGSAGPFQDFNLYLSAGTEVALTPHWALGLELRQHFLLLTDDGLRASSGRPRKGGILVPSLMATFRV